MKVFATVLILTSLIFLIYSAEAAVLTVCSSDCNSTTVQDGINLASDWDEVRIIDSREYDENILVDKSITLTSNSTSRPTIWNSANHVITITKNDTTINNLTIKQNGTTSSLYAIYNSAELSNISIIDNNMITSGTSSKNAMYIRIKNSIISYNKINITATSGYGIYLISSSNNTITSNIINSSYGGIRLSTSNNNTITSNIINTSSTGIYLSSSSYSIFKNNTITVPTALDGGLGLSIDSTSISGYLHDIEESNTINTRPVKYFKYISDTILENNDTWGTLIIVSSKNITVTNVTISPWGMIEAINLSYSNISFNKINTTAREGNGIYLLSSSNNDISNNDISTNGYQGHCIYVRTPCHNNTVSYNNITIGGEDTYGIYFSGSDSSHLNNSLISHNTITSTISDYQIVGINLQYVSKSTIIYNNVSAAGYSIVYLRGHDNNVSYNNIENSYMGSYCFRVFGATNNLFSYNNITTTVGSATGFYIQSPNNIINNNIIKTNVSGYGIYVEYNGNAFLKIVSNIIDVAGYTEAILIYGANRNNISYNNITSVSSGIALMGVDYSNIDFNNITVTGSYNGIEIDYYSSYGFTSTGNNLTSNVIKTNSSNAYGIYFGRAESNRVFESTIDATNAYDIYLNENIYGVTYSNYLVNCSFNKSDIGFSSQSTRLKLYHQYYLDVYVNDTLGNPVSGANVSSLDKDNTFVFSQLTNSSGVILKQILSEFMANSTPYNATNGYYYLSNYTVSATKYGYTSDEKQVNLTQDISIFLTLSPDQTPPQYFDNSTNNTEEGKPTLFSLRWTDNAGLSGYIFSLDNCTNSFDNKTWTAMSGMENWSNVTYTINDTLGCTVRWKVYANDTINNWNVSDVYSFVTGPQYCGVIINSLPYNITQNNTYYCLAKDMYIAGQNAINFTSGVQNSTLDCLGHNLDGNDASSASGVYLIGSDTKNNTVKNCNITDFGYGIYLYNGPNKNILTNNTANDNAGYGIILSSSSNNTLSNNLANDLIYSGIYLYSSSNNILTNNTANRNDGLGSIHLSSDSNNNILTNNTANDNTYYGIYLSSDSNNNNLTNNVANNNERGIFLSDSSNNNLSNNVVKINKAMGILLSSGSNNNNLTNNVANNNSRGIQLMSSFNNSIKGGSLQDNTNDYVLSSVDITNKFTNTNFTDSRKIYFLDAISWFNYNNETTGNIWLQTKVSDTTTITRKLLSWSKSIMTWNDSTSGVTATYNISGLVANKQYKIYNDTQLVDTINTSSSGSLSFTIYLSSEHQIKVEEVVYICTGTQPPESGDWLINDNTFCNCSSGENITVSGNVYIYGNGNFTLDNCILWINQSSFFDYIVQINGSSKTNFTNSVINSSQPFFFYFMGNSSNSIRKTNFSSMTIPQFSNFTKNIIINSTFDKGVDLYGNSLNTIADSFFISYSGLYDYSNSTIINSSFGGILIMSSVPHNLTLSNLNSGNLTYVYIKADDSDFTINLKNSSINELSFSAYSTSDNTIINSTFDGFTDFYGNSKNYIFNCNFTSISFLYGSSINTINESILDFIFIRESSHNKIVKSTSIISYFTDYSNNTVINSSLINLDIYSSVDHTLTISNLFPANFTTTQIKADNSNFTIDLTNTNITYISFEGYSTSNNTIINSTFNGLSSFGLYSNNTIINTTFETDSYFHGYSNNTIINSTFLSTIIMGYDSGASYSTIYFTNTSTNDWSINFRSNATIKGEYTISGIVDYWITGGNVTRYFPVYIYYNTGNPISGATVSIKDNSSSNVWQGSTNSNGYVEPIIIFNATNYNPGNFTLYAQKEGYTNSTDIHFLTNTSIVLTLPYIPPTTTTTIPSGGPSGPGISCKKENQACTSNTTCCSGLYCVDNLCKNVTTVSGETTTTTLTTTETTITTTTFTTTTTTIPGKLFLEENKTVILATGTVTAVIVCIVIIYYFVIRKQELIEPVDPDSLHLP